MARDFSLAGYAEYYTNYERVLLLLPALNSYSFSVLESYMQLNITLLC